MSTGLQYDPSSFSTTELVELSKVLAEYDAVYATHMKMKEICCLSVFYRQLKSAGNLGFPSRYPLKADLKILG